MAGLDPAIHVFLGAKDVDARDKPGHDERETKSDQDQNKKGAPS
jgi:hypothetical protein